ncbi:MAG: efflux RND transporter periplasmic adaptor subunit [Nitrospirae bacterium]|nr:efflux RND transporter periplasmic adaptor subunit [Nitrospirota bacterium]
MKKILLLCCLLSTVYCLFFLSACSSKKEQQQEKKPVVPVTVGAVIKKTVPVQIRAIGNVEAYSIVSVKARVGGDLTHVYFREGQDVNKGDMLFTIDPRLYKTALDSAKANLVRDTALAKKADEDLRRYTELLRDELVSRSQYEQIFANAEALKATVEADKAVVENARLQVEYCTIYAPIAGRTGSLLVNQGNLVKANDDKPMVIINQIQPVYINFSVPEQYLPEIKKYMSAGKLNVEVFLSKEDKKSFHGVLSFMDNTVDTATGTIKLKATFSNKEKALWPGQFVTVRMTLSNIQDAVVVPTQAIQTGQQGQFVFIVKDGTAELRPVTAGITYEDVTVIEKGLSAGDEVVTDGQMRLMPVAKVEIKNAQGQKSNSQKESSKISNPAKDKVK